MRRRLRRELTRDALSALLPLVDPEVELWAWVGALVLLEAVDRHEALRVLSAVGHVDPAVFAHACGAIGVDPADVVDAYGCASCGENLRALAETAYMVTDDVWAAAGDPAGLWCVGCLEERLGRQLVAADFADVPLSTEDRFARSERLLGRMGRC